MDNDTSTPTNLAPESETEVKDICHAALVLMKDELEDWDTAVAWLGTEKPERTAVDGGRLFVSFSEPLAPTRARSCIVGIWEMMRVLSLEAPRLKSGEPASARAQRGVRLELVGETAKVLADRATSDDVLKWIEYSAHADASQNKEPAAAPTAPAVAQAIGAGPIMQITSARFIPPSEEGDGARYQILLRGDDGAELVVKQRLPSGDRVASGWAAIELLTGAHANTVRRSWSEDRNRAAEAAWERLAAVTQRFKILARPLEAGGVEIANPEEVDAQLKETSKVRESKFDGTCRCGAKFSAGDRVRRHAYAGVRACIRCEQDLPAPVYYHGEVDEDDGTIYAGVHDRRLVEVTRALMRKRITSLFVFGRRPGELSGVPVLLLDVEEKTAMKMLDTIPNMRGVLTHYLQFCNLKGEPREPPRPLIEHLINYPDDNVRTLLGLARIPMMTASGGILQREGWDPESKWWFAPGVRLEPVPDSPTDEDVEDAKRLLLDDLFGDFPLVDEGARAGACACLLEQIVRPMINGPRPLYATEAPIRGQGTGKTLAAKAIQVAISGDLAMDVFPSQEDEMAKLVTSLLRENRHIVIFDNVTRTVDSTSLAALTTAEIWSRRLLGTNDAPKLVNTPTWILTMNGAQFSRDLSRRVVIIGLNARMVNAFTRRAKAFKHPDLLSWVRENRAQIVRACLVLARRWFVDGRPHDPDLVMGSFESWCEVVGGILHHVGIRGLSGAVKSALARDVETAQREEFVAHWAATFGEKQVSAGQLGELAQAQGLFEEELMLVKDAWVGRRMNQIVRGLVGGKFGAFTVEERPRRNNGPRYALVADRDT